MMTEADKILARKIRANLKSNRFITRQIEMYSALYAEEPRGEYVKSLSLILLGFGASTVRELREASIGDVCWFLSRSFLGAK